MKKVLLYSGGVDSWLINKIWNPDIKLYIDIHNEYSEIEKSQLPKDTIIIDFPYLSKIERKDKYVPLRNLYFLMIASNYGDEICLGATAGDTKKDSNINFLQQAEQFINYLLQDDNRQIKIEQKFALMNKEDILQEALKHGVTIKDVYNETFSCYTPIENKPCYKCKPCLRKFALLYTHGYDYSIEDKEKIWNYVKDIPIESYNYNSENAELIQTIKDLKNLFINNGGNHYEKN